MEIRGQMKPKMGKKMRLKLSNKFYNMEAVKEALNDFKDVCDGRILSNDIEVELVSREEINEPLEDEFCNYVLGLMKNKTLI